MSHFTVTVVGENVEEQMAAFHEFESTGTDDKYVLDVDQTEEAREQYEKGTTRRYKDPEGKLHDPYGNEYYREPTGRELLEHKPIGSGASGGVSWHSADWGDGRGYRAKIHFVPDGWEDLWLPTQDVKSFRDFVEGYYGYKPLIEGETPDLGKDGKHKYGYTVIGKDGSVIKVIDRTNPRDGVFAWIDAGGNEVARTIGSAELPEAIRAGSLDEPVRKVQVAGATWDWYQVGGRWNGFFKLLPGRNGKMGKAGLQRSEPGYKPPEADRADGARKGDIDFDAMRAQAHREAIERYGKVLAVLGEAPAWESWTSVTERFNKEWDKAREFYHGQEQLARLQKSDLHYWDYDDYLKTQDEYAAEAVKDAGHTFALLVDGKWYSKGRMGWFGCVDGESEEDTWRREFWRIIDSLPDSALLTICDCHI